MLASSDKVNESKDFSKGITVKFSSFTESFGNYIFLFAFILFGISILGISKLTVENRFNGKPGTPIIKP